MQGPLKMKVSSFPSFYIEQESLHTPPERDRGFGEIQVISEIVQGIITTALTSPRQAGLAVTTQDLQGNEKTPFVAKISWIYDFLLNKH